MGLGITKSREVPEGEGSGSRKDLEEFDKEVKAAIKSRCMDPAGQVNQLEAFEIQEES